MSLTSKSSLPVPATVRSITATAQITGPAPRPLDHFKLEVAPEDGQLVVDTSETVNQDFRLTV